MSTIEARIEAKSPTHITRSPTGQAYGELLFAYRFFNKALFGGKLPDCLISLHRHPKYMGYFWGDRYANKAKKVTDEIALNPDWLRNRSDKQSLSTLVHEMVHLWQHHYGKESRNSYHNTQWANKMEELGLMPSTTGQPGGKRTGQKCSHYIIAKGPFEKACDELLGKGLKISWGSSPIIKPEKEKKSGKRSKYVCKECEAQVWGKSGLNISCNDCDTEMVEESKGGEDE